MNVSRITTQLIVYYPSSVSISGWKSVSCWVFSSSSKNSAQGRAVCEYVYPAGKVTISEGWAPEVLPVGAGGMPGGGGVGSGVGSPCWAGRGAPVALHLQCDCGFFVVPFWQGRQPDVWFWRSIARCHCIAAFTFECPGNSTPRFFSSQTSVRGSSMRYFVSSIEAREKHSLAILAIFNARCMSDSSRCTRPPCFAIVADMLKFYKTLVAASNKWNWAVTSTIYQAVASSKVIEACFIHSRGCLSGNASVKIPKLTTSWCSISLTVQRNAIVNHGGFPLRAAMKLFRSSLWTPAVRCMVNWPLFAPIWIYSHPTACCFLFLLLPALRTIFKCASWVICRVAAFEAVWWTNLCPPSCCVRRISGFDVVPANLLVFDALSHGGGGCVFKMCWCGIGEEDDNERKCEALRTI